MSNNLHFHFTRRRLLKAASTLAFARILAAYSRNSGSNPFLQAMAAPAH